MRGAAGVRASWVQGLPLRLLPHIGQVGTTRTYSIGAQVTTETTTPTEARKKRPIMPPHPFWCDYCGQKAPFTIRGCEVPHADDCPRRNENAEAIYQAAVDWCRETGETIP